MDLQSVKHIKQKLYPVDIIKLISALFIFFFHSNMHTGADYGIFTRFISHGAIFMVSFFMMSGFILYYVYSDKRERERERERERVSKALLLNGCYLFTQPIFL